MSRYKITLVMPAPAADTFEAFHNHLVRLEWDTLLSASHVEGGGSHPYVGAVTFNQGCGWMCLLSMRTRFVNYQPGKVAVAMLVEPSGMFQEWSASMRHRDLHEGMSELVYTFSLRLRPHWFGRLFDVWANRLFERATRKRFEALADYLRANK
ncbi:SRPBCC family protein [Pseudomonas indica]|uniref:SRPBCC family protein n=1 Tax=Pseudomonas indica TaxID=137658 RepID=UPI003FCF4647